MTLRPYQLEALEKGRQAIANGASAVLLCMPTGTGKTRTAVEACVQHVAKGGTPLFVAPRRELVEQARIELIAQGLWAHERAIQPAYVRTIQELSMPDADIPACTLVVLDEARHYVADAWSRLREKRPDALYLGLDATPARGDGRGLGAMFDVLIEAISVKDAIAQGYLVPCETLRPDRALQPRELAQDPVDAYCEKAMGTSAILFAPSVVIGAHWTEKLNSRGADAEFVWGDMSDEIRIAALARYEAGTTKVLVNVNLLTEGYDAPRTETIVLGRSFATASSYLQAVGRGLRPHPGKTRCLLLDLSGCSHLHGEPDEPRTWHLNGKAVRRAGDDERVRFCPVCGNVVSEVGCEGCGYSGEMRKRKPRVLGLPIDRFARQRAQSDEEAAKTLARWIWIARSKGYKLGWAYAKFQAVYGRKVTTELKRMAFRT